MALKLISWCWDIFILFWLINMFSNKRTVHRQSRGSRLLYAVPFLLSFWLLYLSLPLHGRPPYDRVILPHSFALKSISVALAVLGLSLAIWARVILGRNWSGMVTFKENHELVVRGPYALVRHPIYTGMLLMFLGTALAAGTVGALIGLPLNLLSFWIKFQQEETLMIENFRDEYPVYMKRVKALIPFVF